MRSPLYWVLIAVLAATVTSCGYKAKVKSPTQIQAIEEKKARKAAKEAKDESPEPDDAPIPKAGVTANGNTSQQATPVVNTPTGTSAGRITVIAPPSERDDH